MVLSPTRHGVFSFPDKQIGLVFHPLEDNHWAGAGRGGGDVPLEPGTRCVTCKALSTELPEPLLSYCSSGSGRTSTQHTTGKTTRRARRCRGTCGRGSLPLGLSELKDQLWSCALSGQTGSQNVTYSSLNTLTAGRLSFSNSSLSLPVLWMKNLGSEKCKDVHRFCKTTQVLSHPDGASPSRTWSRSLLETRL